MTTLMVDGWLGSDCEERAGSPQLQPTWGLAALDPSHPGLTVVP